MQAVLGSGDGKQQVVCTVEADKGEVGARVLAEQADVPNRENI